MNNTVAEEVFSTAHDTVDAIFKPKLVSLFCGAGGLDLGFINSGFDVVYAADYDPSAVKTYNANHRGERAEQVDLLTTTAAELYDRAVVSRGVTGLVEGIIGGPPCQGFSRGNAARCFSDPRNQLAVKYAEIVNYFYAKNDIKFFLFENVPEILAKKNAEFLTQLRNELSQNFVIYEKEINASSFGVPQHRRRYFIAGVSKRGHKEGFSFPSPKDGEHKTVRDFIGGLPLPTFYKKNQNPDEIPFHPNHWTMQPKSKRFLTGEMPVGGALFH